MMNENLLPFQGEMYYFPGFFSKNESDIFFDILLSNIQWKQETIKILGKYVLTPRLSAWYGDFNKAYEYSGLKMLPLPWTKELLQIKEKIEKTFSFYFTSVLLNLYRDGKDSMGWHRDNEKELGTNPVIASVSFGATRIFKIRHIHQPSNLIKMKLTHGSLLLMQGATQHYWEHEIPKTKKCIGQRINLTFRKIV